MASVRLTVNRPRRNVYHHRPCCTGALLFVLLLALTAYGGFSYWALPQQTNDQLWLALLTTDAGAVWPQPQHNVTQQTVSSSVSSQKEVSSSTDILTSSSESTKKEEPRNGPILVTKTETKTNHHDHPHPRIRLHENAVSLPLVDGNRDDTEHDIILDRIRNLHPRVAQQVKQRFYKNSQFSQFSSPQPSKDYAQQHAQIAQFKDNHGLSHLLRFDWTNLPPQTPLGKRMEEVQSQCLSSSSNQNPQPQSIVNFRIISSGLGSELHTWMAGLCRATQYNKLLVTTGQSSWNDQQYCPSRIDAQQQQEFADGASPIRSPLWCYFGHHESGLRCSNKNNNNTTTSPVVQWSDIPPPKPGWGDYDCPQLLQPPNSTKSWDDAVLPAAAEWLFQNVSTLVIHEAERQLLMEAFSNFTQSTQAIMERTGAAVGDKTPLPFYKPSPSQLITVHIRWGDKIREMKDKKLIPMETYIDAAKSLLTPDELNGRQIVFIYLATEDPQAIREFQQDAPDHWSIHTSGPTNSRPKMTMLKAAAQSNGRAGLESLAALLISMEANRFVLTGASNWSRLMNELRKSVVDSRCGNCTRAIDVAPIPSNREAP